MTLVLEMETPPNSDSTADKHFKYIAALLHERHHWLQCVGTPAGHGLSMLTETRSALFSHLNLTAILPAKLPLVQNSQAVNGAASLDLTDASSVMTFWERVEALRRYLFGSRVADLDILLRSDIYPAFTVSSQLVASMLGVILDGGPSWKDLQENWAAMQEHDVVKREQQRTLAMVRQGGWGVGWRHFMECAARLSEMYLLAARQPRGIKVLDVRHMYQGVYGVAHDMFYSQIQGATVATDVALAWACDVALATPAPPGAPFFAYIGARPVELFIRAVEVLKSFPFPVDASQPDIWEPESVASSIASLNAHALEVQPNVFQDVGGARVLATAWTEHLSAREVSGELFAVEHGLPLPRGDNARLKYFLSLCADAGKTRRSSPEFFIFPVCHYLKDRAAFHQLLDPLMPPIVHYRGHGWRPTNSIPMWADFFVISAVQQEIFLWATVGTVDDIANALIKYYKLGHTHEEGLRLVDIAASVTLGDGALRAELLSRVRTAVQQ